MLTLLLAGEELFATDVGGLICTNTTWNLAGSPYIVKTGIVIGCNATLTIQPDVVVKFNQCLAIMVGSNALGKGTLVARGTAESPIIFTSNTDAVPGEWSRIHFTDYAADAVYDVNSYISGSILEHVVVEYGGWGNYGVIFAEKSSPYLNYCVVHHNLYYGIQVDGTNAPSINIKNCEVSDNAQCGIYINNGNRHKLHGNNIYNNRAGGMYVGADNCTITNNTDTNNTGGGGISCGSSNILTGNIVTENAGGNGISCGNSNSLTNNTVTNNTGGNGISCGGSNILTNNTVTNNTGAGISCGGNNSLTNNTVTNNTGAGISCGGGSNTLTGNTISNNTGSGIYFGWGSGSNTFTGNTISNNTSSRYGGGICFDGYSGSNSVSVNTITHNTASGPGGGICFTWYSTSNTLTGNTISDNTSNAAGGGIYFNVNSGSNTLTGNTISDNTSNAAGGGICFDSSGSNTLERNVIQSNISRNGLGVVYLEASGDTVFSQNTITDNYIETGDTGGIYVTGNSERVSLAGDPSAHTYNILQDNDGYWVYNGNRADASGINDINAVYVQWGTSDILLIMEKIIDYFDDSSKAFVLIYPFVYPADFDFDEDVDCLDLSTFVDNWLRQDCVISDWCEGTDLNCSTNVDFTDFAYFAENWLFGVGP
jgi:parallel beta-helix repeat protein